MAVASIYNVPTNEQEWNQWSFAHAAHHIDVNQAILQQHSIALPDFILDPINLADPQTFFEQHQLMHNNSDAVLGISGFDISDVNLKDKEQLAAWIFLVASLHYQEALKTGAW